MNVLVLGGSGFIGSHIVDALLKAGHDVRVLGHSPEKSREPVPSVDYCVADFSDNAMLEKAMDGIDVVFHSLSATVPATSNRDPEQDIRDNLINTVRLLDIMKKASVKRMVFLSSGGTVYGTPDTIPIPENHPLNPLCSYGIIKATIEKYLFMHQQLYGLQSVIIRPSNPYGPRQGHTGIQGVISTFMAKMMRNEPVQVWGNGNVVRDFFHVEDLARLCVMAAESDSVGIFNAGSGSGCSIRQLIGIISDVSGASPNIEYREGRQFDVREVVLDIQKAESTFGWKPEISLHDGIRNYWEWITNL